MLTHSCGPACRHDPSLQRAPRGDRPHTIDFHCHIITLEVEALVAEEPEKLAEPALLVRMQGEPSYRQNEDGVNPAAVRRMSTLDERLADMDRMGVDMQVMSPSGVQYYYWAEEALAERIVRLQNENVARCCEQHPDRLRGLGTVALQHPDMAVRQLRHCVRELGLAGVVVSSQANGRDVSDPAYRAFWKEADQLGAVVFLHPLGTSMGERLNSHYLSNLIGQPLETMVTLSKLILEGVLDAFPGLKLLAAHGGGYFPFYPGRLDHGYKVRPETATSGQLPSEYGKRIWFDTVVHDPILVRHLMDTVGPTQIVAGTDYPYDMGGYDIHDFIGAVPGITDQERRLILGLNAASLLGLRKTEPTGDAHA